MHFIFELLVDLLVEFVADRLIELIAKIGELAAWLFGAAGRLARWIIERNRQRRGMIYFQSGKAFPAQGHKVFSLTGRRR